MKYSPRPNHSTSLVNRFFSLAVLTLIAVASPAFANLPATGKSPAAAPLPASHQEAVTVMVEFDAAPAAVTYAAAYQQALAEADAARIYAAQHPNLKTSKALLSKPNTQVSISSSAARQVLNTVTKLDQTQRAMLPALTGQMGGKVLFRAQRAYNGIAMIVGADKIAAISALPGVKAVHPMHPKTEMATFSDIDFLGGRSFWAKTPLGIHGENIKVADIDTGLDYVHANFGGPGSVGYAAAASSSNNHTTAPSAYFPNPKVPGGYDFAGDAYSATAAGNAPSDIPHPDPDPFDCGGHGTGTASLIAGYGVTNAGFTYSGTYDSSNPDMSTLTIPPGFAPNAKLYPLRVFGCAGSTNLVTEAIEWAMDPNGDGDFSDHMDVVNMSLGSGEGFADDADDVAASNAASIGVLVCSAAGNDGDTYYVHSSPAAASGTLSCAATYNNQNGFISDSAVTGNAPPSIAGTKFYSIFGSASPHSSVTGNVVYGVPNDDATPFTNGADISGKIVMVNRGAVSFTQMMTDAGAKGAIGVIVNNFNHPTDPPIVMSTAGQPAGLVNVMISKSDRDAIVAAAGGFNATTGEPTNPTNVTIGPDPLTSHVFPPNGPGAAAGAGSTDTVPSYTSRGPRLPDSALKPDLAAPAEVTAVAQNNTGNGFENFNGTSSATPHISGIMALIRQLHPTWSVQEVQALACDTATHDLTTTVGGSTKIGVGRIGAGRVDLNNAAVSNVVAYNGTDSNLQGVSFGVVEVPVDGTRSVTKAIKVVNKGASAVSYNITYAPNVNAAGTSFSFSAPTLSVPGGSSATFNVTFNATGSQLRHDRDLSTTLSQATAIGTFARQYLSEENGYAVLTPTVAGSEPAIRVALYAAPKPAASMHASTTGYTPTAATGSFTVSLSGAPVNTGSSFPTDIVGLAKAFELQYASALAGTTNQPTNPNIIKYVGITSDWNSRTTTEHNNGSVWLNFGIEGFGNAGTPDAASSDKEIFIDFDFDNNPDLAIFLTDPPVGTSPSNVYFSELVDIAGLFGPAGNAYYWEPTDAVSATPTSNDVNAFNNSLITIPLDGFTVPGLTAFQYQVVTFDRTGAEVDETPFLTYDASHPGLDANGPLGTSGHEPFFLNDLPSTAITVNYNGTNFQNNFSRGLMVAHMHNGSGSRTDVVQFRKPTITGFSPSAAKVGQIVTITGSNFGPGTTVTFYNNKPATTVNVLTPNTLTAVVPAGAVSGPITVSNAAGSAVRGGFTVLP